MVTCWRRCTGSGVNGQRDKARAFGTDICFDAFNHPIRLAEDLAVLDNYQVGGSIWALVWAMPARVQRLWCACPTPRFLNEWGH